MPFDGTKQNEAVALVGRMEDQLRDPARWCKGSMEEPNGARCLYGALNYAATGAATGHALMWGGGEGREAVHQAMSAAAAKRGHRNSAWPAIDFNNATATTHAELMAFLAEVKADILEKAHAV